MYNVSAGDLISVTDNNEPADRTVVFKVRGGGQLDIVSTTFSPGRYIAKAWTKCAEAEARAFADNCTIDAAAQSTRIVATTTCTRPAGARPRRIVLACSATKIETDRPVMALYLYDGPAYRILRKYGAGVGVRILSAKYGVIDGNQLVMPYEQRLDAARANELDALGAGAGLDAWCEGYDVLVFGGKLYRDTILAWLSPATRDRVQVAAAAGIGYQLSELKTWLTAAP